MYCSFNQIFWLFSKVHRVGLGNIRMLVDFNPSLCRAQFSENPSVDRVWFPPSNVINYKSSKPAYLSIESWRLVLDFEIVPLDLIIWPRV
jgi:hypothetical protein